MNQDLGHAVEGLEGPNLLRARVGDQSVHYTVTLSLLIQVLAFGVFMSALLDGRAMLFVDGTALPHALYTLGTIITVTYIQMTVFPVLRWPLAAPDIAIVFLLGIGEIAASRLIFDAGSWWYAVLPIHIAACAAFVNVAVRLRAVHFGPAQDTYRRFRAGIPWLGLLHAAVAIAVLACAIALPRTSFWTWIAMEAISIAMIAGLIAQERWLGGLYRDFGLKRFALQGGR